MRKLSPLMVLAQTAVIVSGARWEEASENNRQVAMAFARRRLEAIRALGFDVVEKRSVKVRRKRAAK